MFKGIDEYLGDLKKELKGSDAALIQDALSDAEEHLRTALENILESKSGMSESDALSSLIEKYGTPSEIASAYKEIEFRLSPVLAPFRRTEAKSVVSRFYGVIAEPRAWGAFFYMLFSALTGSIFGVWTLAGVAISLLSLILIIGIPLAGLFLLSVRGIALIEGRIVEALLGVRMPRKPIFVSKKLGWMDRLKALFTESQTWKSLIYMILLFPLGLIYFFVVVGMFFFSLIFIVDPVLELVFGIPLDLFGTDVFTPVWFLPVVSLAGFLLLPLTFHLARFAGKIHGRFAKFMLVRK